MPGVKRERDDSVGVLTLDEPETLNAMTPDLLGDLATAIGEINDDPQVRALVLTGAGRGFCSGQNLKAARILGDDIAAGVMKYYWPAFKALRVRRASFRCSAASRWSPISVRPGCCRASSAGSARSN
jgi:2-(1,2-epoxy-1,2-dihydrophenyl)acetyl-CoA isomerase